jgi:anti-sigma factor RsiW
MTWHANDVMFGGYAEGSLDPARASSLEAHLLSCASCRERIVPFSDPRRREQLWVGIQSEMHAPRPGPVEALLSRIGVSGHLARLLAATPSL